MSFPTIMHPTININGTDPDVLAKSWYDVSVRVKALLDALSLVTPHGRDYQTSPDDDAYQHDRDLHRELMSRLTVFGHQCVSTAAYIRSQKNDNDD